LILDHKLKTKENLKKFILDIDNILIMELKLIKILNSIMDGLRNMMNGLVVQVQDYQRKILGFCLVMILVKRKKKFLLMILKMKIIL